MIKTSRTAQHLNRNHSHLGCRRITELETAVRDLDARLRLNSIDRFKRQSFDAIGVNREIHR